MNTYEFNEGKLTLREEFYYIGPISLAIILTSFLLAFSSSTILKSIFSLLWALFSYPVHLFSTWILTKTGLYILSREFTAKAKSLKHRDRKTTGLMKADALRQKMEMKGIRNLLMEEVQKVQDVVQMGNPARPHDLERGQSTGSEMKMDYSPRI